MTIRSIDQGVPNTDTRMPAWLVIRVVGLVLAVLLAVLSLLIQQPLPLLIGVFVGGCAVATAALLRAIDGVDARVQATKNTLSALRDDLQRLEHELAVQSVAGANVPFDAPMDAIDIADLGHPNLAEITAATLDRTEYPRLAHEMDNQPPAQPRYASPAGDTHNTANAEERVATESEVNDTGLANRNLLRSWKVALREGDLPTCRTVFAALVDTAQPEVVAELRRQIDSLARRIKLEMRDDFSAAVRRGDYAAALKIGDRILERFPNDTIANEYGRLEPHLRRRCRRLPETTHERALRIVP